MNAKQVECGGKWIVFWAKRNLLCKVFSICLRLRAHWSVLKKFSRASNKFIYSYVARFPFRILLVLLSVVFGCSLLFVHDGAASTAIWLIKSVIELCDMNNLSLFSQAEFLFTFRLSVLCLDEAEAIFFIFR